MNEPDLNRARRRRRAKLTALPAAVAALGVTLLVVVGGADPLCWPSSDRCRSVNDFRADHDRHGLDQRAGLQSQSRAYARELSDLQVLRHADDLAADVSEIIGYGASWRQIMRAWRLSSCKPWGTYDGPCPGHREILLDRDLERIGIGCTRDPLGTLWCVVRFR